MINRRHIELLPYEILASLENTKSLAERVKIFQDNATYELKTLLQLAFHPGIKLLLPEGSPPYTPSPIPNGLQYMSLKKQLDILPRLCREQANISPIKREMLFIRILESISAKDAEILCAAKEKTLHKLYPLCTKNLVVKSFPTLLPNSEITQV